MAKISTIPEPCDWEVYAGDRNLETFQVTAGDPVDCTGATITAQARASADDAVVAATAVVDPTDLPQGRFALSWDGEALRTLLNGALTWTGVWDVQMLEAGQALPVTLLRGAFTVVHDVTRAGA